MTCLLRVWRTQSVTLLLNCIKKIEKEITKIFTIIDDLKEKQIKDESHLQELSEAVNFITKKFNKYEQERTEKEEIINNLMKNVSRLTEKVDHLSEAVEKQEQYSRCNCLLVHGIPEKKQENADVSKQYISI